MSIMYLHKETDSDEIELPPYYNHVDDFQPSGVIEPSPKVNSAKLIAFQLVLVVSNVMLTCFGIISYVFRDRAFGKGGACSNVTIVESQDRLAIAGLWMLVAVFNLWVWSLCAVIFVRQGPRFGLGLFCIVTVIFGLIESFGLFVLDGPTATFTVLCVRQSRLFAFWVLMAAILPLGLPMLVLSGSVVATVLLSFAHLICVRHEGLRGAGIRGPE